MNEILFEQNPNPMLIYNTGTLKIQDVNKEAYEKYGYTKKEFLELTIKDIRPREDIPALLQAVAEIDSSRQNTGNIYRHQKKCGERFFIQITSQAVDELYENCRLVVVHDVTEQVESVKEKQVLLEEIHHRVKNNLAVISSILHLQEFESEDHRIKSILSDSQMRIKSIALIHEMLYREKSFSSISFNTYIRQLVERIHETFDQGNQKVNVHIKVDQICLNINQAVPCALLLNELLTNAYKHAFKGGESGTISISIGEYDERIFVRISDNGIGMPDDFENSPGASLGMSLIHTLSEQIEADLEYSGFAGTTVEFSFPKKVKTGSSSLHLN